MRKAYTTILSAVAGVGFAARSVEPRQAQTRTLKMQSSWPASLTLQENFTYFAERVDKLSGGSLKIDAMPAGQVVPAFEVLDATHKKVIDGAHTWAGYWTGKNKASILFTGGPGGTFGMDMIDAMGWLHTAAAWSSTRSSTASSSSSTSSCSRSCRRARRRSAGSSKPIETLADMKGMKCRQTGIAGEVWQALGFTVVNMPGGEIIPSAQRGVIDCAEWVGGVEDLRLGFHNVWKYHYSPGVHETVTIGEVVFNARRLELAQAAGAGVDQVGGQRGLPDLVDQVAEAERRSPQGIAGEARRADPADAGRDPARVPQGLGQAGGRRVGEEPVLQEGRSTSQKAYAALVVPMKRAYFPPVLLPRQPLLPAGRSSGERNVTGRPERPPRFACDRPLATAGGRLAAICHRAAPWPNRRRHCCRPSARSTGSPTGPAPSCPGCRCRWSRAVTYEVIARYLFNAPTIWAFDVTYMLYGTLFMLGAAYALHKGAHIRTDFFWEQFSVRKKGVIDAISYRAVLLSGIPDRCCSSASTKRLYSWRINELSDQTPWRPILWPFKAVVPLACLLLLIQGVSEFLKSLYMARTGIELEHKEKVEV